MTNTVTNPTTVQEFILRSTADGILVTNAEGILTYVNPAGAAMLGITPEATLGKPAKISLKRNPNLIKLCSGTGEVTLDVTLPGQRVAQGIADTVVTGERVIVLQDVTEQRDIETRRLMLSKTLAHDLRNPIAAVRGFIDLVSKFGDTNEQQNRFITRARQTSDKLQDMIKTLVDLAWIEAGMPLQHVPIRLDEAIQKIIRESEAIAQRKNISIAVSLQTPLPIVMGDPERLNLAIQHLIHNAILYSPEERTVAVHAWGDEHEVFCSVADQGIGIAESEQQLIFDRMYRSRDERVRALPGGGLGLTIARTIIHRHGGDIWVTSRLNEGSSFTFYLPAVQL